MSWIARQWRMRSVRVARHMIAATILTLAMLLAGASASRAATLYLTDPDARLDRRQWFPTPGCNLTLEGTIHPGDSEVIKADFDTIGEEWAKVSPGSREPTSAGDSPFTLCLSGDGGDLAEAIKIANLFSGWNTVVQDGDRCVSACAIVFMRALDGLTLFDWPNYVQTSKRYLHRNATLGFHAPRLVIPRSGDDPATTTAPRNGSAVKTMTTVEAHALATEMYSRALASVRAVILGSDKDPVGLDAKPDPDVSGSTPSSTSFVGYGQFSRSKLPLELLLAFLVTPPDEMFEITTINEAQHWGIEIFGIEPPRALTASMLLTACMNYLYVQCQQGRMNSQCPFESTALDTSTVSDTKHWTLGVINSELSNYEWDTVQLWPQPADAGNASVIALRLKPNEQQRENWDTRFGPQMHACAIRLFWENGRLRDAEIHTSNGEALEFLLPEINVTAEDVASMNQSFDQGRIGPHRLRPWRMLPSGARLKSLGQNPWAGLLEDQSVTSRPPGW